MADDKHTTTKDWILYFNGYGKVNPIGCYATPDEVFANKRLAGLPVWDKTGANSWIGKPQFASNYFYTLNKDGEAVYRALTRPEAIIGQPRRKWWQRLLKIGGAE